MRRLLLILTIIMSVQAQGYRVCEFAYPAPNLPTEPFRHNRNRLATFFEPHHSGNDAITTFGEKAGLEGKFSYGLIGKDLSHEFIDIWIDNCGSELVFVHRTETDSEGRVLWFLPTEDLKSPGEYKVWMRVVGDDTFVRSTLRVMPKGTKVAIFDIDGTITATEIDISIEVISDLIGGTYSPPKRDSSAELSRFLHERLGFEIVYLSGRHYFLNELTKTWLDKNDFAPGSLILTQSFLDVYPNNRSVGKFKVTEMSRIKAGGILINRGYGNALTDVYAYQQAGLASDKIFLLGRRSGAKGAVGLGSSFEEHFRDLLNAENDVPE